MERIVLLSDRALLERIACLDRAERDLHQSVVHRAAQAEAAGGIPQADSRHGSACAAREELRARIGRIEEELLRRTEVPVVEAA